MPKSENLTNCPRCQHIKDDNVRCGSPAIHGKSLCYFHDRQRHNFPNRRRRRPAQFSRRADFFNVQTPDDVMRAINQVMNAVLEGQLSDGEANSILFALQTASPFAPHTTAARAQITRGAAPFPNGEGASKRQMLPRVPHPSAQRKGGSFDFPNTEPLPNVPHVPTAKWANLGAFLHSPLPEQFSRTPSHWPPKTVDEIFEMFPGCEDLKALLTPEEIAFLDSANR